MQANDKDAEPSKLTGEERSAFQKVGGQNLGGQMLADTVRPKGRMETLAASTHGAQQVRPVSIVHC